jgi:hypothetical protein
MQRPFVPPRPFGILSWDLWVFQLMGYLGVNSVSLVYIVKNVSTLAAGSRAERGASHQWGPDQTRSDDVVSLVPHRLY